MRKYGFTLIELLIVLVIISVLAGALVPMFRQNKLTAQIARASADTDAIKTSAMMYHYDTGQWPPGGISPGTNTGAGLIGAPTVANWAGPYLDTWSVDPWGTSYQIYDTGTSRRIRSLGPDKAIGGTGDSAADIDIIITPNTSI